jgi:hypothetical protein
MTTVGLRILIHRLESTQPLAVCSALAFLLFTISSSHVVVGQVAPEKERLRGVLSRQTLYPPLRSTVREVRFSPDGSFLLVQDESGIFVLSRDPLRMEGFIGLRDALPARFSANSKTLVVASKGLEINRWGLPDLVKLDEKLLAVPDGCLSAQLSLDGEIAACADPDSILHLFRTSDGEKIFTTRFGAENSFPMLYLSPRGFGSPFAEPVGLYFTNSMRPWEGRANFGQLVFAPDGRYLLAEDFRSEQLAVDIAERKKIGVPDAARLRNGRALSFVAPDQLAVVDAEKSSDSKLISFPAGKAIDQLPITGLRVEATSDAGFLFVTQPAPAKSILLDLNARKTIEVQSTSIYDLHEGILANVSEAGELQLTHINQSEPFARIQLFLDPLPMLRAAAVSPGLESLALAIPGTGGVFRTSNGDRVAALERMEGAWWPDENSLYLRLYKEHERFSVQMMELPAGAAKDVWKLERKSDSHSMGPVPFSSGPIVLEEEHPPYYVKQHLGKPVLNYLGGRYQLRALEMKTGKILWLKSLELVTPVPFVDPQGDRIVLGWPAESIPAHEAVKRAPEAAQRYKAAKLSERDSVFEVLDAVSGKTLGSALVQSGAGPLSFSCAFSVGDMLILGKDGTRIILYSLHTGEEKARFFGARPSANSKNNLLAAANADRLTLHELTTGTKRDELTFPDVIAYTHFSADGRHLLVLTQHQTVFVLDVGSVQNTASPAPSPVPR